MMKEGGGEGEGAFTWSSELTTDERLLARPPHMIQKSQRMQVSKARRLSHPGQENSASR